MKTEDKTFDALYARYYSSHNVVVRNIRWPAYAEVDVLAITRHGFLHEFEIKSTRADFLAEMRNKADKHMRFFSGYGPSIMYFVTPLTVKPEEVPGEIGLIHFYNGKIKMIKKARKVHNHKVSGDVLAMIANRLTRRIYGNMRIPHGIK